MPPYKTLYNPLTTAIVSLAGKECVIFMIKECI